MNMFFFFFQEEEANGRRTGTFPSTTRRGYEKFHLIFSHVLMNMFALIDNSIHTTRVFVLAQRFYKFTQPHFIRSCKENTDICKYAKTDFQNSGENSFR